MFWFNKKKKCPIRIEDKDYIEETLLWLENEFGSDLIRGKKVLFSQDNLMDKPFSGSHDDVYSLFEKIGGIMDVDLKKISVGFYVEQAPLEFTEGLYSVQEDSAENTSGQYTQFDDGSIEILIEEKQLNNVESLIATISHELAHVKLLGEGRTEENNEILTELTILVFGLGVFNANSSIAKMNTWSNSLYSGWKIDGGGGYLHYKLHGYALALYANYRKEMYPDWAKYLNKDIKNEFEKSIKYIQEGLEGIKFK